MYEFVQQVHGMGNEPDQRVVALQLIAVENGCQLPGHGADGIWGPETEQATACLAARFGWPYVIEHWPWVPNRPQDLLEQQRIVESPTTSNREWLLSWTGALATLVIVISFGSYITERAEKRRRGIKHVRLS